MYLYGLTLDSFPSFVYFCVVFLVIKVPVWVLLEGFILGVILSSCLCFFFPELHHGTGNTGEERMAEETLNRLKTEIQNGELHFFCEKNGR